MTGEELKQIRESFNLTQVEYAEELGVHPVTLSRFERGRDPITKIVELAICELSRRLKTRSVSKLGRPRKLAAKKKVK